MGLYNGIEQLAEHSRSRRNKMDITKEEDVTAAVEQTTRGHGGVDILINNILKEKENA